MLINTQKKCDNQPNPHVASVELIYLGTSHCSKYVYMQDFVQCCRVHYVIKCWFCGPDKGAFYADAYITHTHTHTHTPYMSKVDYN